MNNSAPGDPLFLQVETTGTSLWYDRVAMIGWETGGRYDVVFPGAGDDRFAEALASAGSVVAFNGPRFDFPFLKKQYPRLPLPARRIGARSLPGRKYGAPAVSSSRERRGEHGPTLWYAHRAGDPSALGRLIENNHAAIQRVKAMMDDRLAQAQREPGPRLSRAEIDRWIAEAGAPEPLFVYERLGLGPSPRVVGIDLTGSEARPSGWCHLEGRRAETSRIRTDEEIAARIAGAAPALVSIDAPLSLPEGRIHVSDTDPTRARFGITRACERVLRKRGIGVYPPLLPSMQALTARGIALAARIRAMGVPVIEGYPGGAQDILGVPRKKASLPHLQDGLARFGITGEFLTRRVSHDELDAITAALVGLFFLAGFYEALGDPKEGCLIVPNLPRAEAGETGKTVLQ